VSVLLYLILERERVSNVIPELCVTRPPFGETTRHLYKGVALIRLAVLNTEAGPVKSRSSAFS
jgi:hypothetical protein